MFLAASVVITLTQDYLSPERHTLWALTLLKYNKLVNEVSDLTRAGDLAHKKE